MLLITVVTPFLFFSRRRGSAVCIRLSLPRRFAGREEDPLLSDGDDCPPYRKDQISRTECSEKRGMDRKLPRRASPRLSGTTAPGAGRDCDREGRKTARGFGNCLSAVFLRGQRKDSASRLSAEPQDKCGHAPAKTTAGSDKSTMATARTTGSRSGAPAVPLCDGALFPGARNNKIIGGVIYIFRRNKVNKIRHTPFRAEPASTP